MQFPNTRRVVQVHNRNTRIRGGVWLLLTFLLTLGAIAPATTTAQAAPVSNQTAAAPELKDPPFELKVLERLLERQLAQKDKVQNRAAHQAKVLDKALQPKVQSFDRAMFASSRAFYAPLAPTGYGVLIIPVSLAYKAYTYGTAKCWQGQAVHKIGWIMGTAAVPFANITSCSLGGKVLWTDVVCGNYGGGYHLDGCTFNEGLRGYSTSTHSVSYRYSLAVSGGPLKFTANLNPLKTDAKRNFWGTWRFPTW